MFFSLSRQRTSADVSFERFRESTLFSKTKDRTSTVIKTNWLFSKFPAWKTYILKNIFPTTKLRGPVLRFLRPSSISWLGMAHRRWIFFTISPKTSSHFSSYLILHILIFLLALLFSIFLFFCQSRDQQQFCLRGK